MHARVIVVAGPSGSGKSVLCARLATRLHVPVVNLDDFYKDGDDPTLPRVHLPAGPTMVDWDHPESWSCEDALEALERLCTEGSAAIPVYDIAHDGRVGHRELSLTGADLVVAEGIFADRIVDGCRSRGLLAEAVCVRNPRLVTFVRRLTRDLREARKPPWVLLRRGLALLRSEPAVVERARRAGCRVMTADEAFALLTASPR